MDFGSVVFLAFMLFAAYGFWKFVTKVYAMNSAKNEGPVEPESAASPGDRPASIHTLIEPFMVAVNGAAIVDEVYEHPALVDTARAMLDRGFDDNMLIAYAVGDHYGLRCAALRAIAERGVAFTQTPRLVAEAAFAPAWYLPFGLRAIAACVPPTEPVVGEVLVLLCVDVEPGSWLITPIAVESVRGFLIARRDAGESLALSRDQIRVLTDYDAENAMRRVLARLGHDVTADLQRSLDDAPTEAAPSASSSKGPATPAPGARLEALGRVWDRVPTLPGRVLLDHPALERHVSRMQRGLTDTIPRSCLLVGEPGVGKRSLVESLGQRLLADGWQILEAGHTEVIADQKYVGQFEARLQTYARALSEPQRLWYIPDFGALRSTGTHEHSTTGALQLLRPWLERGELRVVGTLTPVAYEKLLQHLPWVRNVLDVIRVEPLDGPQSSILARAVLAETGGAQPADVRVIDEAWLLAEQYLSDRAAPGNLLQLIAQTRQRLAQNGETTSFARADLVATLVDLTGLPAALLDDQQDFDLAAVRAFFAQRILGQREAVECLVQRIAMMKAGLTDATRPQGVFLLAGPTGTGKTEIAKVLAEFLFGSPQRLVRIDMSEFNTPGSAARLLSTGSEHLESGRSLVSRVRQQPFSVVLLDEFEKSSRDVWDLFLQVADDGRLTDDHGDTVDFRHTIVILTSNVGALVPTDAGVGFGRSAENFRTADVEKAIAATFRREFVNRLDRVVVFKPFTRDVMRELLQLEIRRAAQRRGLRFRDWAPIWDHTAIDFLLERGFTADLGARPLRRAVERHLLEPLAELMAQGRAPGGEQFLFVHAGEDTLVTTFVDPDAPDDGDGDRSLAAAEAPAEGWTPQHTLLDPRGGARELAALRARYHDLAQSLASPPWVERKESALAAMARGDFWADPERFAVLGRIECLDRLESGMANTGVLLEKLVDLPRAADERAPARFAPRDLVAKVAGSLYLIGAAMDALDRGEPWEAYVLVEAGSDDGQGSAASERWARRVVAMHESWARRRHMRRDILRESNGQGHEHIGGGLDGAPWRQVAAVSGFAAYSLLALERGLHVWEEPDPRRDGVFHRVQAFVHVVPQPPQAARNANEAAREAARLLADTGALRTRLVRHYREAPTPLVRDRLGGWRTGRLDRVLGGDFDLLGTSR